LLNVSARWLQPRAENTFVENSRRELNSQLQAIQAQIGATNKEVRARKAARKNGSSTASPVVVSEERQGTKSKKCPLRSHAEYPAYFLIAAQNELDPRLFERIERAAKSLLAHALRVGIEK
jgi:hypothetical protein